MALKIKIRGYGKSGKVVKRKYKKKNGIIVTREYYYESKGKEVNFNNIKAFTKTGKLTSKAKAALGQYISEDKSIPEEDLSLTIESSIISLEHKYNKGEREGMSVKTLIAKQQDDDVERLLVNMGYDPNDENTWKELNDMGITELDLRDSTNWSYDKDINRMTLAIGDLLFDYDWDYDEGGSVLKLRGR